MRERYFDRRLLKDFSFKERLTEEEAMLGGKAYSLDFLHRFLRHVAMSCAFEAWCLAGRKNDLSSTLSLIPREQLFDTASLAGEILTERHLGVFGLWGNWWEALDFENFEPLYEDEDLADVVPSDKIGHYKGIAADLPGESVFLAGKLLGTKGHMEVVNYLASHALVVLGIETEAYYRWEAFVDPLARSSPFFKAEERASLWAHHPCVAKVFVVPPDLDRYPPGAIDRSYKKLFLDTGATYSCATRGSRSEGSKLARGKVPKGEDWRRVPVFKGPSTRELLAIKEKVYEQLPFLRQKPNSF